MQRQVKMRRKGKILPPDMLMEILKRLPPKTLMRFRCVSKTWNLIIRDPIFARLHCKIMLMEILKGLPPKALMRFRCVSKTWNLVILDPIFAQLHRKISETRPGGTTAIKLQRDITAGKINFYRENHPGEQFLELTIKLTELGFNNHMVMTDMINGLICFYQRREVIVCNIFTHELISLPPQAPDSPPDHIYSFGYDPLNNEYKVLCISRCSRVKCAVFTIGKSKEWREVIDHPLGFNLIPGDYRGITYGDVLYHNGAIHWLSNYFGHEKQILVSFDVREEKFRNIHLPDGYGRKREEKFRNFVSPYEHRSKQNKLVKRVHMLLLWDCGSKFFRLKNDQVWVKMPSSFSLFDNMDRKTVENIYPLRQS